MGILEREDERNLISLYSDYVELRLDQNDIKDRDQLINDFLSEVKNSIVYWYEN